MICLGVGLFGVTIFRTSCASKTCMSISFVFTRFGKVLGITSSNKFSILCSLFFSASTYMMWVLICFMLSQRPLNQGSPTPRPWTSTTPWLIMNQDKQQGMSRRWVSEASLALWPELYLLSPLPPICGKIVLLETGPCCQKCWGLLP